MGNKRRIHGLLLDLDGVFYVGDRVIAGSRETLDFLREQAIPFRFITNTTTRSPVELSDKLSRLGIDARPKEIFTAASATIRYLQARGKPSCHLLLRESIKPLFDEFPPSSTTPDYVVIGDIGAAWNYENLNTVFNMLMRGSSLICMHRNKYWQGENGLLMDIGAFVAALEYVSSKEAIVIGKPSPAFFQQAIQSLDLEAQNVAIAGDDIDSDIGGGQAAGLQGILVKTGKYREIFAASSSVNPDFTIDSVGDLPHLFSERNFARSRLDSD